ncbi:hypothetical protein [Lysinibacillus endophyticus]|uniref:hypothetical protein n=1 Tax=Ureibacillus endophyticus TaxID=1978490 RepID=UPI003134B9DC
MLEKVKLLITKPTLHIEDLSMEIELNQLGIQTNNITIPPIRINLLSDELLERYRQIKQQLFNHLVDTAITFEWNKGNNLHVEDDLTFAKNWSKREVPLNFRFNDYLYFLDESNLESFTEKFHSIEYEFESLLEEIVTNYDEIINIAFKRLVSNFPSVKFIENEIKSDLLDSEQFAELSEIDCGFFEVWLEETEPIIQKCKKEIFVTANTIVTTLLFMDNNESEWNLKYKYIGKAIARIKKYNVIKDKKVDNVLKKLEHLYLNWEEFKGFSKSKRQEKLGVISNQVNQIIFEI